MRSLCLREPVRVFLPLLLYALDAHGQTVQIVTPRPPISFPVGSNVTFQCEATGSRSALWEVNTTQLAGPITRGAFATRGIITEPGPVLQEIGTISYTLYALASFENNRTVITCQASASVLSSFVSSDNVTLLVFGLPNPPTGLSSSPQAANTLRLQWEAPFSLPGENISYILHTRNLRTDTTMNGVTVTGTSTTFERPQEDQACDRYEFTVCSNNAVGPSENCTAVEASTPSAPQRLEGLNVSLTMEGGLAVTMSFSALSCPDYPVTNYSAILILPERIPQRLGVFLPSGNNPETITITEADGLLEDRMYTVSVEGRNQFGRTSSEARTIYTTDVQSASVEVEGDNVTITCTFLSGSNAQGCNVEFTVSSNPTSLWTGNISREDNSNTVEHVETIELPAENNYVVSVRDLEADGSVGQTALSATVNVIPTIATTTSQATSTPTTSLPPGTTTDSSSTTSDFNVTFSTVSPTPNISRGTLFAIIGGLVGVIAMLFLCIILAIFFMSRCIRRNKLRVAELADEEKENPDSMIYCRAYEQCTPRLLNAAKANENEDQEHAYAIPSRACDVPVSATAANPMYGGLTNGNSSNTAANPMYGGVTSANGTGTAAANPMYAMPDPFHDDESRYTDAPSQPVPKGAPQLYEEVTLKSATGGLNVEKNVSYGLLPNN